MRKRSIAPSRKLTRESSAVGATLFQADVMALPVPPLSKKLEHRKIPIYSTTTLMKAGQRFGTCSALHVFQLANAPHVRRGPRQEFRERIGETPCRSRSEFLNLRIEVQIMDTTGKMFRNVQLALDKCPANYELCAFVWKACPLPGFAVLLHRLEIPLNPVDSDREHVVLNCFVGTLLRFAPAVCRVCPRGRIA